jgi:hypothetical protein
LETQVLTDELKKSIIVQALIATHTEYLKGYNKACKDAVEYINNYSLKE